jgi:hypothetical protein
MTVKDHIFSSAAADPAVEGRQQFGSLGQSSCTPGLPDPALIRGDWTGEAASRDEREALAHREGVTRLRSLYVSLSRLRESWANSTRECSAARAVAYQTAMSRVGAIIEDIERLAAGS